jgi:outer membrane protein assembly factor BamB
MRKVILVLLGILGVFSSGAEAKGSDWPNWRGPYLNGSSDTKGLPEKLELEKAVWSVALPGPGASTPAIFKGRVYLTSTEQGSDAVIAMCINAADGSAVWQKTLTESGERSGRNTPASPSPVVDENRVYFLFGNGVFVCLEHDGKEVWRRNLVEEYGPLAYLFGFGSSPLLYEGTLYVPVLRRQTVYRRPRNETPLASYLLAVEAATGKTVFYYERSSDALDETTNSYITPVAVTVENKPQIVLFGADYLTAHDPKTGRELMRYQFDTTKNDRNRNIPTPITDGAMLYVTLPRGTAAAAYDVSDAAAPLRWKTEPGGPDASSPALYKGHFYMIDDRAKTLMCVDIKDGAVRWRGQLDRTAMYFAAVMAADDKIYTINEAGTVTIASADPTEFRLLSTTAFGQSPAYSTISAAEGRVYVRTAETLYCFEKTSN